jgi:hypothetical protein
VFSKSDPYHTTGNQNHTQKIGYQFFIPGGNSPVVLYLIEKYHNKMPLFVNMPVIFTGLLPAAAGGDDHHPVRL